MSVNSQQDSIYMSGSQHQYVPSNNLMQHFHSSQHSTNSSANHDSLKQVSSQNSLSEQQRTVLMRSHSTSSIHEDNNAGSIAHKHALITKLSSVEQRMQRIEDSVLQNSKEFSTVFEKIYAMEKHLEEKSKYQEELLMGIMRKSKLFVKSLILFTKYNSESIK